MPTQNKFAVLTEVSSKSRQIVISDGPKKPKKTSTADKTSAPVNAPKNHAANKSGGGVSLIHQSRASRAAAQPKAPHSDAPTDLRAAADYNRRKAEEKAKAEEARAVAARSKTEEAAVKGAATEAQDETLANVDAAKEAANEAAEAKAPVEQAKPAEPEKPVMTLEAYNKQRAENLFAIGAKQARKVDTAAVAALQKVQKADDELVIKKKETPAPAKPAAKKGAAAPAPKQQEKKEKAEKLDLNAFADYSNAPRGGRGRGGDFGGRGRGGDFAGRGGYRGGDRMPNVEDKRAFPTL